jgi:hypothetical protein
MASYAKPAPPSAPARPQPAIFKPPAFEIRRIGPALPRVEAPEGWLTKTDRPRQGKVWVGYFHVWESTAHGERVRRKKEKTLGPATIPRH